MIAIQHAAEIGTIFNILKQGQPEGGLRFYAKGDTLSGNHGMIIQGNMMVVHVA
ncbi:hypothetical protein D9M68_708690 [compost metagenome]